MFYHIPIGFLGMKGLIYQPFITNLTFRQGGTDGSTLGSLSRGPWLNTILCL
jgi:hypothetical protein